MSAGNTVATLVTGRRTWAIGAVHGEFERLCALHEKLTARLRPDDDIVYLGNFLGRGASVAKTVDELLGFRRAFLAKPPDEHGDIFFLRGGQEEIWHKLLQIQFSTGPGDILEWMLGQGAGATLSAYGSTGDDGLAAAREGVVALTKWTDRLRDAMRRRDGHNALMSSLLHAAVSGSATLFVSAGLDPQKDLSGQGDAFWWGGQGFESIKEPKDTQRITEKGFKLVVRGFAANHPGIEINAATATVDGGCGFGGPLLAACFSPEGEVVDRLEV